MQLFFSKNESKSFTLSLEESKHVIKVLRKRRGDKLNFTNGKGYLLNGEIVDDNIKKTKIRITKKLKKVKSHKYHLNIAISLTKNIDRFEWFLEKATEIGVDEITPIICDHSEKKYIKKERCKKILISSIKQSLKYHLPKLNEITYFKDFIKKDFKGSKYIAHCKKSKKIELKEKKPEKRILILIGPEGDFSNDEIKKSIEREYEEISLGNNRLRTETAGIVAVNIINLIQ